MVMRGRHFKAGGHEDNQSRRRLSDIPRSNRQSANSTENAMRSDRDIKRDVEDELRWDPDIGSTDIAVSVNNAVVTLT
jgi:osmotically-inducible protein OsmY